MNEITLATLIEEKFRGEALSGNDKRKYIGNDWLIDGWVADRGSCGNVVAGRWLVGDCPTSRLSS